MLLKFYIGIFVTNGAKMYVKGSEGSEMYVKASFRAPWGGCEMCVKGSFNKEDNEKKVKNHWTIEAAWTKCF